MTSLFHSVLQAHLNDTYSDKFLGVILMSRRNLARFNPQQSKLDTVASFTRSALTTWDNLDGLKCCASTAALLWYSTLPAAVSQNSLKELCFAAQKSSTSTRAIATWDIIRGETCRVMPEPKLNAGTHQPGPAQGPHIEVLSGS